MVGIKRIGAYVPRLRLSRRAACDAMGWIQPGIYGAGRGERAMANWDEDALTMAVEAGRRALSGATSHQPGALIFASTTAPFAERLNASIAAAALGLPEALEASDVSGSRRSGLVALRQALRMVKSGDVASAMVVAGEMRPADAVSAVTLRQGDAGAAVLVGSGDDVVATVIGNESTSQDFVDSYRATGSAHENHWEDRWIREEGYQKLVGPVLDRLFAKAKIDPASISHVVFPCPYRGVAEKVIAGAGLKADCLVDHLDNQCGDTGAVHPLLLLGGWLETAMPGQRVLVIGFAQGCDAMVFEATPAVATHRPSRPLSVELGQRIEEKNYLKFMVFRGLVPTLSLSGERFTSISAAYRDRDFLNRLTGLHCEKSGETFFGTGAAFKATHSNSKMVRKSFADSKARILIWSADYIMESIDPPASAGVVIFEEGGKLSVDFTDFEPNQLASDLPVEMVFRISNTEPKTGLRRYFWKARPVTVSASLASGEK
jgi:3-hydroxy-3-methylglutaryl CoA synthase/uncharacterized OB-fold protein